MATVKLEIYVADIAAVLSSYNVIEIQRSVTAPPSTTPVDLTEDTAQPAVLIGSEVGPFDINAKILSFAVNGITINVTFASSDPIAIADVVIEINTILTAAGIPATASDDGAGKLKLETDDDGTQYTLEIFSSTALAELGFIAGAKDNGEAAHITLVSGTEFYFFDDDSGLLSSYYRTRYYNDTYGTYSSWSDWFQGAVPAAVGSAHLIIGRVKLADLNGAALPNRKITLVNVFEPNKKDGYGIFGKSIDLETDEFGMAGTALVKDSLVDIIFSGTSIIRRIRVPNTGTEFDLLSDSLVVDGELEIKVPDLPYAPRRS